MEKTFSNTDAAVCGGIAIAELIFFVVYVSVSSIQIRKKIISMGRLIPSLPVIVIGSGGPPPGLQVCPPHPQYNNPYYNYNNQPLNSQFEAQAPPPPPGFYPPPENPPPYSAQPPGK